MFFNRKQNKNISISHFYLEQFQMINNISVFFLIIIIYSIFCQSYFCLRESLIDKIKEYMSRKFDFSREFSYHFIDNINRNNPLTEQVLLYVRRRS